MAFSIAILRSSEIQFGSSLASVKFNKESIPFFDFSETNNNTGKFGSFSEFSESLRNEMHSKTSKILFPQLYSNSLKSNITASGSKWISPVIVYVVINFA